MLAYQLAWIFNTHLIPIESRYVPSFGSKLATAQLSDGAKDYSITFSRGVRCGKSDFTLPDVDDQIFTIINSVVWRETQKNTVNHHVERNDGQLAEKMKHDKQDMWHHPP